MRESCKFCYNNLNSFPAVLIVDRENNAQKKGDVGSCVN